MKQHVRAAVAAISLSHSLSRKVSSVYDYGEGGYANITISINNGNVKGFDYTNSCHIEGRLPNLYHYGESCHIDLKPSSQGGRYNGYDHGAGCHFEITVSGNNAEVYDYGSGGYFSYST